ncbi:hypothetical protein EDD11_003178 [Mortierella claussenii]|nr:hypothetical protein EDD11_003178 [Mortierella claussenii]
MSFENLSEVLWSTPGGTGIFGFFGHHSSRNDTSSITATHDLFGNDINNNNHHLHHHHGGTMNGMTLPPHNFVLGISIAVATSFIQSLGLTIQRKSHVLNEAIHPKELRREACHRPLWHLGFHTYILSNVTGTIFSIGYLPVIILAPLGAVTLVFNALFARLLLGDVFSWRSAGGTFLILLGAILIGLFGIVPEPSHSLEDLIQLWKRPAFIVYFSLIEFTVVSLLVGNRIVEQMLKRDAQANLAANLHHHQRHLRSTSAASSVNPTLPYGVSRVTIAAGGGGGSERASFCGKWMVVGAGLIGAGRLFGKLSPTEIKIILGVSYGCVSGMLSSQALLFAKSAIELLTLTILEGKNQFENPLSWFLVIALIAAAFLQLYYLNRGLRLCDTVLLVPLSFCAYNVSCLFNGLVYYDQWGRLNWWQILLVLFGISLVLIGVLVLAWRPASGEEYGDDGTDGDEATLLLPNTSRPSTPRHNRVFSFKGVSGEGSIGGGFGGGGGNGGGLYPSQDRSMDARHLIQGFEMYDSDEDDLRTATPDPTPQTTQLQHPPMTQQQDARLVDDEGEANERLQSPRTLSFAPAHHGSSK